MTIANNDDRIHLSSIDEDKIVLVEPYNMAFYDQQITHFYATLANPHLGKLISATSFFLNQPYFLEPLGEGKRGVYSQEPLYRTDKFDCVSYVNTILALINSCNVAQFHKNILAIRYNPLLVSYIHRTDWFTDLEWLPNARRLGWIKDITGQIFDKNQQPIAQLADTLIDKPNWYKVKPLKVIHLLTMPDKEQSQSLLNELRSEGNAFQPSASQLTYLPFVKLFNPDGSPNQYLFDQIPCGSLIAVVRPNWQIRDEFPGFPQGYGTNLNVSHLGIGIRTELGLQFYNASSLHRKVECQPLIQYLAKYLTSSSIKGIHIEKIIY